MIKNNLLKKIKFTLAIIFSLSFLGCSFSNNLNLSNIDGGIGGTGIDNLEIVFESEKEGGIGGTGIIGTITDFGSIIVNGIRINYLDNQNIKTAFGIQKGSDLKIGQVVNLTVKKSGNEIFAENISTQTLLYGKIQYINLLEKELIINDEKIKILDNKTYNKNYLPGLKIGNKVSVSGFRGYDKIYSSLIESDVLTKKDIDTIVGGYITSETAENITFGGGYKFLKSIVKTSKISENDFIHATNPNIKDLKFITKVDKLNFSYKNFFNDKISNILQEKISDFNDKTAKRTTFNRIISLKSRDRVSSSTKTMIINVNDINNWKKNNLKNNDKIKILQNKLLSNEKISKNKVRKNKLDIIEKFKKTISRSKDKQRDTYKTNNTRNDVNKNNNNNTKNGNVNGGNGGGRNGSGGNGGGRNGSGGNGGGRNGGGGNGGGKGSR